MKDACFSVEMGFLTLVKLAMILIQIIQMDVLQRAKLNMAINVRVLLHVRQYAEMVLEQGQNIVTITIRYQMTGAQAAFQIPDGNAFQQIAIRFVGISSSFTPMSVKMETANQVMDVQRNV